MPARINVEGRSYAAQDIDSFKFEAPATPGVSVNLIVDSFSSDPETSGAALIQVEALDGNGERIPIPGWEHVSTRVNEYKYLDPGDQRTPATTHITVKAPEGADLLRFTGRRWKQAIQTMIVGETLFHTLGEGTTPLHSPTGAALSWTGADFRHTVEVLGNPLSVTGHFYARGQDSGIAPLQISLYNEHGEQMLAPEGLPANSKHGTYVPINLTKDEETRTDFEVTLPNDVRSISFHGLNWGKKTATYIGAPTITFKTEQSDSAVHDFLAGCTAADKLIVIDTTAPPLGHETLALRPNNLALEYARTGAKVLFIPFGSTQDQPAIPAENCAQVPRGQVDAVLNRFLSTSPEAECIYICSSYPSYECLTRMERLQKHGWHTVYEIRDDMEEFNRVGYSKWYHPLLESRIGTIADQVVAVSTALADKIQVMGRPVEEPRLVPNGVRQATLDQSAHLRQDEPPTERVEKARVGYVGHLTASWFDWPALIEAARALPEISFDIVGHGKPDSISLPENIDFHGPKTHEELLGLVPTWKVGLIPFMDSPLTRGVDPNKIYEYYAWGLRVVTSRMGAVERYPSTWVYTGAKQLTECISEAQSTPVTTDEIASIREFAESSSWRHRAQTMLDLMEVAR